MITPLNKSTWQRKGLIWLTGYNPLSGKAERQELSARNLEAGSEAGPQGNISYELFQLAFVDNSGPPPQGWYSPQWTESSHSNQ